jgi:hypothetical protein
MNGRAVPLGGQVDPSTQFKHAVSIGRRQAGCPRCRAVAGFHL